MQERPILFSAPMVRAILNGRKTQTRRAVKPAKHPLDAEIKAGTGAVNCPFGHKGDRLWVRETWNMFDPWPGFFYAADDHSFGVGEYDDPDHIEPHNMHWRPSIHMPRIASRITLVITGVRIEHLQDISAADCLAEGVAPTDDPVAEYRSLWESLYGAGSWAANPHVFVIEFVRG
nr:MAG TPA: ASCH domain protein [Caudoviricetes sp.]